MASFSLAVGGTVSYSRVGVGVINTQHYAHLALGQRVLDQMEKDVPPHEALAKVLEDDPDADSRQLLAIDAFGRKGAWTGRHCVDSKRHAFGTGCVAAGNHLVTEDVIERMVIEFEESAGKALGDRLLQALQAGERIGGDRRGRMAAGLSVTPLQAAEVPVNLDLRVDCHPDPIVELAKLRDLFRREFRK